MSSRPPQPLQPGSAAPTIHGDQKTQNFGFARSHGHFVSDSLTAETCTKSFALSPPTVRLPSGDSTPQRVDSGFQDDFDQHPASPSSANSLRSRSELYSAFGSSFDGPNGASAFSQASDQAKHTPLSLSRKSSAPSLKPVSRTPSFKSAALAHSFGSANSSRVPSPIITAMGDVTPLPSPLLSGDSPGPWKRLHGRPPSRETPQPLPTKMAESVLVTSNGEWLASALANQPKQKDASDKTKIHTRNRSISEYHPDHLNIPKRMLTVSGPHANKPNNAPMRREPHLSESRGLTPIEKPPSPPPSESSVTAIEASGTAAKDTPGYEYFDARGRKDGKLRRWRAVKTLGQGTFSRVVLATSHLSATEEEIESESRADTGLLTPEPPSSLDRKSLVAVKICEHGPKGGASEDRVEMSLKRELEIMQSIHHPSLVDLKAFSIEPTRAILVLSYCPGGDLFDTYPYSVTTLTDLGLSRRVADDEKLTTRCGSEDYAAPEVIMGLPYDGRTTDAWSLGVLLYALLESRLPFDPPPGMSEALRMRSRTSHRIARVEWQWIKYAGDDGDHEGDVKKFEEAGLLGAMEVTEGLLQRSRSRWSLEKVAEQEWVSGGVTVEGGMRFREEKEGEIV
ncbi:hypothetical protein VSDG_07330 [Cytospora chrysosperma]|uniref:Protein kinase domain-containing protein n=1 Tax=Cytospora chrysosperma TaxID=252740 RepID=A0A423VPW3_CYTCH|nr:hypothetical protein VSDG_07330 [Valsa sordida]